MRCEVGLCIRPSNDRSCGLFYLLTWVVWHRSSSSSRCCIPSIALGSAVSWESYWPGIVYRWWLRLGPGPKNFQQCHTPYLLGVVQSIDHHCISRRCSCHMVHDAGIGWWRILMTMAQKSLVYGELFQNPRRWQKVNVVGILFL